MIRNAHLNDLPAIAQIAKSTNMFIGEELGHFMASLRAHFDDGPTSEARLIVACDGDRADSHAVGAAYFAPELMAQGVMNLLFVGVLTSARKRGHGKALLDAFERDVRASHARRAIIETASDDMFAPAWSLYRGAGYGEEARIRDFYEDGLDKLVFSKRP